MSYDKENIFAKILRGEIPCERVFENEEVLAIKDIEPAAPVHLLVIPKGEYSSFDTFSAEAGAEKIGRFFAAIQQIAKEQGVIESGYRLITNHGKDASQTVPHFHVHLLAGRPLGSIVANDTVTR